MVFAAGGARRQPQWCEFADSRSCAILLYTVSRYRHARTRLCTMLSVMWQGDARRLCNGNFWSNPRFGVFRDVGCRRLSALSVGLRRRGASEHVTRHCRVACSRRVRSGTVASCLTEGCFAESRFSAHVPVWRRPFRGVAGRSAAHAASRSGGRRLWNRVVAKQMPASQQFSMSCALNALVFFV